MLQFEIKKIFSKFKNRMAVLILLVILVAVSMLTMNRVEYIDSDGNHVSGMPGAKSLRAEKNKWKGNLTEDVLKEVARENASINNSTEALSDDNEQQDKAYARKQGISSIAELINNAFSEWRDYNYYAIDNVSIEEAGSVYERRVSNLKKYLDSGEEIFTDLEKEFLIQRYEELKTPFYYEYTDGWSALLQNVSTFILILALIIGFLVSGIFSDEFQTNADAIFFSSKLGRNRAVLAKMGAGFAVTTVFYVVFLLLYTAIVLAALGADGANCPIQMDMWRSAYNITFMEAYLLIAAGGYVGTMFASTLSMLASAAMRSTATAIIVPFIVLCAFPFLSRVITLPGICSFFPDQLLEIYITIKEFNLVQLGGRIMNVATLIIPAYALACLLLWPLLYRIYRKAEVS
ncbi:MAG: ABC transporter permease [Lachnospiraceae bacterium]|nr:ABC transporter permease [Lachnospiraceae bacterium]